MSARHPVAIVHRGRVYIDAAEMAAWLRRAVNSDPLRELGDLRGPGDLAVILRAALDQIAEEIDVMSLDVRAQVPSMAGPHQLSPSAGSAPQECLPAGGEGPATSATSAPPTTGAEPPGGAD